MAKPNNAIATIKIPGDTDARPIVPYYVGVSSSNNFVATLPTLTADAEFIINKLNQIISGEKTFHDGIKIGSDSPGASNTIALYNQDNFGYDYLFGGTDGGDYQCPSFSGSLGVAGDLFVDGDLFIDSGYIKRYGDSLYTYTLPNTSGIIAITDDIPTNLENGTGTNSLQQKGNTASNIYAFAQGYGTESRGNYSHSEGAWTIAHADISHTEGAGNVVGDLTETAVRSTGQGGHAEGLGNLVLGQYAHAEGANSVAKGDFSHVSGIGGNDFAHPENSELAVTEFDEANYIQANSSANTFYSGGGMTLILSGFSSGTQTYNNFRDRVQAGDILKVIHSPSGNIEQYEVNDIVSNSIRVKDTGANLKWQSGDTSIKIELKIAAADIASGTAYGIASFVAGFHNIAVSNYQTVVGKYNNNKSNTLFEVGNGTSNSSRSNAFEVYADGHATVGGKTIATTDVIPDDSTLVHTTGTETIGGEKTFSIGGYSVAFHAFNNNDQHLYIELDNGGGNGSGIRYNDDNLNNYHLYFPRNNGTLILNNEVPKNQAHSIVVYDATHNISGKNLSAYTAVETTLSGYPVIIIKTSSSVTLTEEQARSYMAAQTGSTFLPIYDYDRPTYTYFIFANGKLYKPQYDTTNGLVLYYLNQIAFASSAAKVTSAEFVQAGYDVTIVIANSSGTSAWQSTIVYDDAQNTHEIGRFSSANGTLTVNTETGVIDVVFSGGMVYISSQPTVTSGITIDYGDSSHYRFNIANSGTITFDGNIDWDD